MSISYVGIDYSQMFCLRVELTFAVFGLFITYDGGIAEAPPIMQNWIGQQYGKLLHYYERKGNLIDVQQI